MNHDVSTRSPLALALALALAAVMSMSMPAESTAQTIARDGDGEATTMRSPNAAEAKALAPAAVSSERRIGMVTGKVNPPPILHSDGTVEQELDASTLSYTVARTNADGSISMVCVTGEQAAHRAMTGKSSRAKLAFLKRHSHDVK